ncbi:MAG TPA: hypothetical protein VGE57_13040 [Solimonas sp.]
MFSIFDPLVDFHCPRCGVSLRFRRVEELPGSAGSPNFLCACPACGGAILSRQHAAFPDNWRWMRFLLPGIVLAAVGIFVPAAAGVLPAAVVLMGAGLLGLIAYMVYQRWGWQQYGVPAEDAPDDAADDAQGDAAR